MDAMVESDHFRYRLLLSICSLLGEITHDAYTMMRVIPINGSLLEFAAMGRDCFLFSA